MRHAPFSAGGKRVPCGHLTEGESDPKVDSLTSSAHASALGADQTGEQGLRSPSWPSHRERTVRIPSGE